MAHEEKRYVLYDYLRFFWNKKWVFLAVPLLTLGLAFLYSMLQPVSYQGRTIIFTGDFKGSETDPAVVKDMYKDEAKGLGYSVEVFERGQLVFTVTGSDKEKVQKVSEEISSKHFKLLQSEHGELIRITEEGKSAKEKHLESLDELMSAYESQMSKGTLSDEEQARMSELQLASTNIEEGIVNMEKDIALFEAPQKLDTAVEESSRNTKAYVALGLVAGIFLSLVLLVFWKYIDEARRYRQHD
ncbi:Wzz/FepE/Etk N-terminal domain-containing protein [Fictibacillus iocasae]|uniref:Wzz/FepE/Etk N-terminal domain-containing protein n=1 Tax=Fictibacillus iocasae TaxID=2715437 RepID=A0ABW2NRH3_9BACL